LPLTWTKKSAAFRWTNRERDIDDFDVIGISGARVAALGIMARASVWARDNRPAVAGSDGLFPASRVSRPKE
jgi:hypothetical protein